MRHIILRRLALTRGLAILAMFTLPIVLVACGGTTAPAATSAPVGAKNLILSMDTVLGSANVPQAQVAERSCILNNRYPKNSQIVWRARVYDPKTGDLMDDKTISTLQVKLANETVVSMKYGAHPKGGQEFYWTGSWTVPMDQPTGTLGYSVAATASDGRTGEFTQLNVPTSLMTITDEVFPVKQG